MTLKNHKQKPTLNAVYKPFDSYVQQAVFPHMTALQRREIEASNRIALFRQVERDMTPEQADTAHSMDVEAIAEAMDVEAEVAQVIKEVACLIVTQIRMATGCFEREDER